MTTTKKLALVQMFDLGFLVTSTGKPDLVRLPQIDIERIPSDTGIQFFQQNSAVQFKVDFLRI